MIAPREDLIEFTYELAIDPQLAELLRRIIACLPAAPAFGKWEPIETAPRDGTFILAWCIHPNARAARWIGPVIAHWTKINDGGWSWPGHSGTLTHWMPVPAPPPWADVMGWGE